MLLLLHIAQLIGGQQGIADKKILGIGMVVAVQPAIRCRPFNKILQLGGAYFAQRVAPEPVGIMCKSRCVVGANQRLVGGSFL